MDNNTEKTNKNYSDRCLKYPDRPEEQCYHANINVTKCKESYVTTNLLV